jgi:thymidine phosphorylase
MVAIGVAHGLAVTCELTDMEQPLGNAVGNSLEIAEAIATLHGQGPADLVQLTRAAGAEMLVRGRKARDTKSALARIDRALADGAGFAKFRELVAAQGGDVAQVDDPAKLPRAPRVETLRSPRTRSGSRQSALAPVARRKATPSITGRGSCYMRRSAIASKGASLMRTCTCPGSRAMRSLSR